MVNRLKNLLYAGSIQILAGITVIVNDAASAEFREIIAERVEHVFAMVRLRVQSREIALCLVVGGTSCVNNKPFLFCVFYSWHNHVIIPPFKITPL
ncbi:MAG: hypothetical protein ABIH47_09260 [Candidatus Omnitrophota bacterium]